METTDQWPVLWQALWEHGASSRKEEGARRFWDGLSKAQQNAAFENLMRKLHTGGWVQYDPIRAIKENSRTINQPEPEWLRGDEGGDLVQVLYKGLHKICTRDTMIQFGLEWVRDW